MPSYDALLEQAARCSQEAYRPGTRAAHARALKMFVTFSSYYGVDYKAPHQDHVLAFIQHVKPNMKSPASIRNVIGSLSTAFKRMDVDSSVFTCYKVQMALKSIEVNSRYCSSPKMPITPEELDSVITQMRDSCQDPAIICAISFAFTGLFRQSNLAPSSEKKFDHTRHLTWGDITRVPGGVEVKIKWSKTIQKSQDATSILLPRIPGRGFCPVMTLDYMLLASPARGPDSPLFITRAGRTMPLGLLKKAWTEALIKLDLPTDRLSLHSLRSGGATAAWGSGQVTELDMMRHGTWSSTAWRGYVRPSQKDSTVTKALKGLNK